jgi:hypothetical protein
MEEINKIGNINSVNDFFEFKISIKTIILIIFVWSLICLVVIVLFFGGINNTVAYMLSITENIKTAIRKRKEVKKERAPDTKVDKKAND